MASANTTKGINLQPTHRFLPIFEESCLLENVKQCLVSVLEIGVGCSTDSAGERMKTADIARKIVSLRDAFVAANSVRRRRPNWG
ncbi:hypothetical protein LINPERHAP2_LOCUS11361 [Linum perenne]